jgi:hypothetical protein
MLPQGRPKAHHFHSYSLSKVRIASLQMLILLVFVLLINPNLQPRTGAPSEQNTMRRNKTLRNRLEAPREA